MKTFIYATTTIYGLTSLFLLGHEIISFSAFVIIIFVLSIAILIIEYVHKCTVDIMTALANIAKYQIRREMEE